MCDEKLRLLNAFDKAAEYFSMVTSDLKIAVETSPADFQSLMQRATAALAAVREAKLALWKHRSEHHC